MTVTPVAARNRRARRNAAAARRQAQLTANTATARKRARRRNAEAFGIKGATEFSSDPVLSDPVQVVELFKRFAPQACLELIDATTPAAAPGCAGAPRLHGSWALVFFAHIMSGNPDWQPWYHEAQSTDIWRACGFEQRPSWQTTYLRFRELEHPRYVSAFERAANRFVRIAAHHVPHGFDFVHTDGSPGHSHAKLVHACPNEDYCATRRDRATQTIARATDEAINDDRHERSRQPEPDNPDEPPDNRVYKLSDEQARRLGLDDWRESRYFTFGRQGHIMRCRDKHVGVRAYNLGNGRKRKVWVGGYFLPAVSDYFWAPFALHFFEADIQEHLGWPELHRKAMRALNDDLDNPTRRITAVIADKAFTNRTFIGYNTEHGIASITPERGLPGGRKWENLRDPEGRWDEHGPRCRYCGAAAAPASGPGEGFALTGSGDPRIAYRCTLGWHPECREKMQTISCRREYRALLPIGRRERIFHDLLASHSHFEGIFDAWRDRYAVSGTSNATRSKRRASLSAQRLRAAAALLAEWFRICLRQGYIGNHCRLNRHKPVRRSRGLKGYQRVIIHRRKHGLELPVGPMSQRLPFRQAQPPPKASP